MRFQRNVQGSEHGELEQNQPTGSSLSLGMQNLYFRMLPMTLDVAIIRKKTLETSMMAPESHDDGL